MANTLRNGGIGVFFGILACTSAWAATDGWTRVGYEYGIEPGSPEEHKVREWLEARAAPEPSSLGALFVDVTWLFPGQSASSAWGAIDALPGAFPPATTDGNRVRILSCAPDARTQWTWRAKDGQWILQRYTTRHATASDAPCDTMPPLTDAGA